MGREQGAGYERHLHPSQHHPSLRMPQVRQERFAPVLVDFGGTLTLNAPQLLQCFAINLTDGLSSLFPVKVYRQMMDTGHIIMCKT